MKRMVYQGNLLSKTLVIGIIILFIGMSIVSSTSNIVEDISSNTQVLDSVDNSEELLLRGKIAYAYIAYGPDESVFCYFNLDDPGNITGITGGSGGGSSSLISGGTWTTDGRYLACEPFSGILLEIDPDTGYMSAIGGGGTGCHGLAWDPVYDRLYGTTGTHLIEYDPGTGEQTVIGSHFQSTNMVALAINLDGICYSWDVKFEGNAILYTIDLETGEATVVGDMGINLIYAQGGAFDWDTDILYLSAYNTTGFLATCDVETAELTLIGDFEGGAELDALAIPYENDIIPPVTSYNLDPPEPDGLSGWYVSDVNVTLTATDDMSGVKEIHYRVCEGEWKNQSGESLTIILDHDCLKDGFIEFYAVDFAGNQEEIRSVDDINIDQLPPEIDFEYEVIGGNELTGWDFLFTTTAIDDCSGVDRVEFFLNGVLQDTVAGSGPTYTWGFKYWGNLEITISVEVFDIAGNSVVGEMQRSRQINQESLKLLFLRLIERFPLLEVFLRAINLLR